MWMARDVKVRNNPCITIAQLKKKKKKKHQIFVQPSQLDVFVDLGPALKIKSKLDTWTVRVFSHHVDLSPEASCHRRLDAVWIGEAPNHLKPKAFLRGL